MKANKQNTPLPGTKKSIGKDQPASKSLPKYGSGKKQLNEGMVSKSFFNEPDPSYSISSRIRPIGNSNGVILPNRVIEEAGITPDADLIIKVYKGVILIAKAKTPGNVNTDLSSWGEQFKHAIKKGNKPETDVWDGMKNRFDEEEWV